LAWFGVLAIQAACAAYAFVLDKEKLTPLLSLPLQQILYRQLMYVVLLQSWITALTGGRLRWQKLRRKGGVSAPPGAELPSQQVRAGAAGPDLPSGPPPAEPATRPPARDRYFDLLRAVALFRVVLYHLMGWAWLPVVFPSMGVMFALAGNLMARSLKRPAVQVVRGRMRRLLPPLWLLGAIGVTGMLAQGWSPDDDGHPGWWFLHLGFWILPLSDPPYAEGLPGVHGVVGEDWA